ncbi:hypothetical protein ACSSVZ_002907 [Amorphus sp. MBR-141]
MVELCLLFAFLLALTDSPGWGWMLLLALLIA